MLIDELPTKRKTASLLFWLFVFGFTFLLIAILLIDRTRAQELEGILISPEEEILEPEKIEPIIIYEAKPVVFLSSTKITADGYPIDVITEKPNADFLLGEVARYKRALNLCGEK